MNFNDTKTCEYCKTEFQRGIIGRKLKRLQSITAWNARRFCSLSCKSKATVGRGTAHPNYRGGKTRCLDCGAFLAQRYSWRETARCRSCSMAGERHWNWKGGITALHDAIRQTPAYRTWRAQVFERDDFACVKCGDGRGGNLEADHILPFAYFPELRFTVANGRTLCKLCHTQTPTYGPRANAFAYGLQ